MRIALVLLWVIPMVSIGQAIGQEVRPKVSVDSTYIRIGDPLRFQIEVEHEPQVDVVFPLFAGKLGELEILHTSKLDTLNTNGVVKLSQTLILTAFDSGYYQIPSIGIPYTIKGSDDAQEVTTNHINIEVVTVAIDTTAEAKPIKGPMDDPFHFREALPYIVLVALLALIIGGILWYRRWKKKNAPEYIPPPPPKVPPHIIAMKKLADVEKEKLWQQGHLKEYYSQLSFITREYLEGRYEILALESTTDEILDYLRNKDIRASETHLLRDLLQTADLAKYAKFKPTQQESMGALDTARTFVKQTADKKIETEETP